MGVKVSFTINNCGECDHVHHLRNYNYSICGHFSNERCREDKKCSINRAVDPPVFNPSIPIWCPLLAGESYKED